jgi:hypothetical protein
MKKDVKTKVKSFTLVLEKYEGTLHRNIPRRIDFAGNNFYHSLFEFRKTFPRPEGLTRLFSYKTLSDSSLQIIWYGVIDRESYITYYTICL